MLAASDLVTGLPQGSVIIGWPHCGQRFMWMLMLEIFCLCES